VVVCHPIEYRLKSSAAATFNPAIPQMSQVKVVHSLIDYLHGCVTLHNKELLRPQIFENTPHLSEERLNLRDPDTSRRVDSHHNRAGTIANAARRSDSPDD